MCIGPGVLLGSLGLRRWYRCRNCGAEFSKMSKPRKPQRREFPNTLAALAEFDRTQASRDASFYEAQDNAAVAARLADGAAAAERVARAFLADTPDLNSWSQCRVMSVSDIRRIVTGGAL
jgi:hypothetical protein